MTNNFNLEIGDMIAEKYEIIGYLGGGWEGEVFRIKELRTQIVRAAKIFFPKRNKRNRTSTMYAKKLHKLRSCPALIQYQTFETMQDEHGALTVFISEYVEGQLLTDYLKSYRGKRLPIYQGIHLLHALSLAVESIHQLGEYHGDLHAGNIMIQRLSLQFDLKLLDLFNLGRSNKENLQNDILGIIKIFYDAIGGQKFYKTHPAFVKGIVCGLKQTLILKKFKTATHLRNHLESSAWD